MYEQLKLDKQLCFRLYNVSKEITRQYSPLLKELGLTYPQYLVMLVMWQSTSTLAIKEIGQQLNLDTGTLSPLLKRLEKQLLINRTRNPDDERVVSIALTAKGKHLKQKAKLIPVKLFQQSTLSYDEMITLSSLLDKMTLGLIHSTELTKLKKRSTK